VILCGLTLIVEEIRRLQGGMREGMCVTNNYYLYSNEL
jgi:hypothetical protein